MATWSCSFFMFAVLSNVAGSLAGNGLEADSQTRSYYYCTGEPNRPVYPPRSLLTANGAPQPFAKCCDRMPFDNRAHQCCGDGIQTKKKGFKDCCANSTYGVCDDEMGCWGSAADCALQMASLVTPLSAGAYAYANAMTNFITDKSIGQWLVESALSLFDGDTTSNRQTAKRNFESFAIGAGMKANATTSKAWKERIGGNGEKLGTVIEMAQAGKKVANAESTGERVEEIVKGFVTLLDAEKSKVGKFLGDKSSKVASFLDSNVGQKIKNIGNKVPISCLAIAAYDCTKAYTSANSGRKKRSQVMELLADLEAQKLMAAVIYHRAETHINQLNLEIRLQQLGGNPFLASGTLLAVTESDYTIDGEAIIDTLMNETAEFFTALKRSVDPTSERGARLSFTERDQILAVSKNRTAAVPVVSYLARIFDEYIRESDSLGVLAVFKLRLELLNRQMDNVTLANMYQLFNGLNKTMVDGKFSIISTQRDGSRIYAFRPEMTSNGSPFFMTLLPLPSGYTVESAIRVSRNEPKILLSYFKQSEGIIFSDVYDHEDLTYFFKIQ